MIKYLRDEKLQLFWFIFHALIGFGAVYSKFVLIAWFYIVAASFLIELFGGKEPQMNLICFLAYMLGLEVLARGIKAAPFIPYEIGKYSIVFLFLIGLSFGGPVKKISAVGMAMLLLSIPAILIVPFSYKAIVFNYFGPLGLFFGVIFCSKQIINYTQIKQLCRIIVYSVFSLACFAIFKASTFDKIEYTLLANYQTSGGSITNQVATLFGTAICILVLMFLTGQRLFKYVWMDVTLLLLFTIRGLLTFSRGGMVSAALAILVILIIPKGVNAWKDNEVRVRKVSLLSVVLIAILMVGSFFVVNSITGNFLLWRYQGKTQRSLETGFETKNTIDHLSAGRYSVMVSDINMFVAHPALGIGIGMSPALRSKYGGGDGIGSHLEFSRLLAEHGFLGLLIVLLMYVYPFLKMLGDPNYYRRIIMTIFLIMGLSATFHNAMRTMITPLLFSFAFINIVPTGYDWKAGVPDRKTLPYLPRKQE